MSDKDLTALSDEDKAVLFLYLCASGLPPWAVGHDQWKALAAITGWDEARTIAALEANVARGWAGKKKARRTDAH